MDKALVRQNPLHSPQKLDYQHEENAERKCPKCESVFVSKDDCETCGFQFSFKEMKHPTDERGFYGLQEYFWETRGFREKWLSLENSDSFHSYIRKIQFRYDTLVAYLTSNPERDIHPVYKQEFADLIDELLKYGVNREVLFNKLEEYLSFERQSFLNEYYVLLGEDKNLMRPSFSDHVEEFFAFEVAGAIRVGTILALLMATSSLLLLANAFYRYLAFQFI
jgi:hypothetical protein